MTDLSISIPDSMLDWLEKRVGQGDFIDVGDYLRDLVRREQKEARKIEWLREQIAEGEASGYLEADPRDVLSEIMAQRHARNG